MKNAFIQKILSKSVKLTAQKINIGTDAMISFTFDDAPLSAFTNGAKILEAYGYRGTFYVSGGLAGRDTSVGRLPDLDMIKRFYERGHEIGNHTYDHLDCQKARFWEVLRSIRLNRKVCSGWMSGSFAYPYGATNNATQFTIGACTTSARGISSGINKNDIDIRQLKAVRIYNIEGIGRCLSLVNECAVQGGWLIFYTHDVCDTPSDFGCTPEQLRQLVHAVYDQQLHVATIDRARRLLRRLG